MALQDTPGSADTNVVQFRIERGAAAMGTDGPLGTVEQIVVDRDSGVLRALIVRSADGGAEFELPADHVQRSVGDSVYLDIGQADLATHPELATPYDPDQYVPVYQGETAPTGQASRRALDTEHPVVTDVEENAAELVAPEMTPPPSAAAGATAGATATAPATDAVADSMSTTWVPRRGAPDTTRAASTPSVPSAAADDTVTVTTGKAAATENMDADVAAPSAQGVSDTGAPPETLSTRPAVTGPLIGGKPTTSGMGTKAAVPRSDETPYDNPPTPPSASVAPPSPGMVQAFSEAGSEPAFASPSDRSLETDAVEVEGVDISTDMPSPTEDTMAANVSADTLDQDALNEDLTGSAAAPEVGAMPSVMPDAVPAAALAGSQEPSAWSQRREEQSEDQSLFARMQEKLPMAAAVPTLVLAAAGLGVGITAIVLRQQQAARRLARQQQAAATAQDVKQALLQVTEQAKQGMRQAKTVSKRAANQAKTNASQATGQAKSAASQATEQAKANASVAAKHATKNTKATTQDVKRTAKRTARRARWFRRGLLLGSGLAILFAPQPGTQLREQIASAVEQVRSKIA